MGRVGDGETWVWWNLVRSLWVLLGGGESCCCLVEQQQQQVVEETGEEEEELVGFGSLIKTKREGDDKRL